METINIGKNHLETILIVTACGFGLWKVMYGWFGPPVTH